MFIGHFAVALAAKRAVPQVSLGTLFLAAQLADLVWPVLVLLGVESVEVRPGVTAVTPLDFIHYPWSHSLAAMALWGVVLAAAWLAATRSTFKGGMSASFSRSAMLHRRGVEGWVGGGRNAVRGLLTYVTRPPSKGATHDA